MDESRANAPQTEPPLEFVRLAHNANEAREARAKVMAWAEQIWKTGTPDEQRHATDVIAELWASEKNADLSWEATDPLHVIIRGGLPGEPTEKANAPEDLIDEELEVLYVLDERETLATNPVIQKVLKEKGIVRADSTIKGIARRLCDLKLANRPRKRKGIRITPQGRAYLSHR